jgi:hypothetical protein
VLEAGFLKELVEAVVLEVAEERVGAEAVVAQVVVEQAGLGVVFETGGHVVDVWIDIGSLDPQLSYSCRAYRDRWRNC